jgi:hypothetical protein
MEIWHVLGRRPSRIGHLQPAEQPAEVPSA